MGYTTKFHGRFDLDKLLAQRTEKETMTELTNDDRIRILRELDEAKCFCGARKARRQTFCRPHYSSLPDWMRNRLYQRAGDGYEEAYTAAREYFEKGNEENHET